MPAVLCHLLWWPLAVRYDYLGRYEERWPIVLTMVFGAVVAGATSEGGGAVAFPVMTMAFKVPFGQRLRLSVPETRFGV